MDRAPEPPLSESVDDDILDVKHMRKTKIVATLGPTSSSYEDICMLGDKGVNVCRLNMSHGDHASHKEVVDKIKKYNALDRGCMAILLDTKARRCCPAAAESLMIFLQVICHQVLNAGYNVRTHCQRAALHATLSLVCASARTQHPQALLNTQAAKTIAISHRGQRGRARRCGAGTWRSPWS